MKYIILGVNRVAKDFLYIFENLEILYFVEIEIKCAEFLGYPVYDLAYALNDQDGYDQIILCDFDKKKYKNILTSKGLQYGTDFIYEEDFFETLDEVHIPKNRKIAVWGTGLTAKKLANYNIEWNTDCYIDTYKRNEQFNGIKVVTPDSITDWKTYFIIIAVEKDQEIRDVMINKGLMEKKILLAINMQWECHQICFAGLFLINLITIWNVALCLIIWRYCIGEIPDAVALHLWNKIWIILWIKGLMNSGIQIYIKYYVFRQRTIRIVFVIKQCVLYLLQRKMKI